MATNNGENGYPEELAMYLADILSLVRDEDTRYRLEGRIVTRWYVNRRKEMTMSTVGLSFDVNPFTVSGERTARY